MPIKYTVPGPCTLSWATNTLGYSKDGIRLRPTTNWKPITDDEHGTEPADFIMAGKSCIVEAPMLDMTSLAGADPYIGGKLLWNTNSGGTSQIGKLLFDGINASGAALSAELIITERDGSVWKAKAAAPSDPNQLVLASQQELIVPIVFVVVPDAEGNLFYTVPSYISS